MSGDRELFISIVFSLLAVSHSLCVPCSVKMALESHQATATTMMPPNNSSNTMNPASIRSESPVGTSESLTTASNTLVPEVNTALPVAKAALATLNETLTSVDNDDSFNSTSPSNANDVEDDSSSGGNSKNPAIPAQPWMKLSRMTREEERGESEITDSNSIGELNDADAERVSFVTESAAAWQPSEEELNRSDSSESDALGDGSRDDKETENTVESLGSAEDRFGAVYPYLYRQEFLRERFWPIYRKHPYNSYVRYPIFPGK